MILRRIFHTVLTLVYGLAGFWIGSLAALAASPFSPHPATVFWRISRIYLKGLVASAGIRLEVSGLAHLPSDQPVLLVSNHQSLFDIPILVAAIPRPFFFVAKKELFDIPFFGWYMRRRGDIPLRRTSTRAINDVEQARRRLENGEAVLIFPEGTRSADGALGAFKRAGLAALMAARCPVIPVAVAGSYGTLPRGRRLITPQRVRVTIDAPYPVDAGDPKNLVEGLRQRLADLLRSTL